MPAESTWRCSPAAFELAEVLESRSQVLKRWEFFFANRICDSNGIVETCVAQQGSFGWTVNLDALNLEQSKVANCLDRLDRLNGSLVNHPRESRFRSNNHRWRWPKRSPISSAKKRSGHFLNFPLQKLRVDGARRLQSEKWRIQLFFFFILCVSFRSGKRTNFLQSKPDKPHWKST